MLKIGKEKERRDFLLGIKVVNIWKRRLQEILERFSEKPIVEVVCCAFEGRVGKE